MSDPLDLETLKARADARREAVGYYDMGHESRWRQAEADLQRTIEIAEEQVDDILMLRKAYFDVAVSDPFWQTDLRRAIAATEHYEQHCESQEVDS